MVSVDTNILVRFLTKDDDAQFQKAYTLFQTEKIFITDTVLLETEWVLRYVYKCSKQEILQGIQKILGLSNVFAQNHEKIVQVIELYKKGLDFADAFHLANSQQFSILFTFDEKFIKRSKDLTNCTVRKL
ncbi:MAG: type II toxin-antitoxin system VapC family toxin [Leptospiraceae bacterium]|nr:type II toxin-antitoxin system VapC family toxin [Leptospiraceae bacterium]MCP5493200.1 type II toxin-antitoxin system VapC family toxin [Leptospiraceae bacterium]